MLIQRSINEWLEFHLEQLEAIHCTLRYVATAGSKIDSKDLRNGRDTFDISLSASLSLSPVWHINL